MYTATLTSQGQITVPAGLRHKMGLKAGDSLTFVPDSSTWKEFTMKKSLSWEELGGILKPHVRGAVKLTPSKLKKLRVEMYFERYKRHLKQND